MIEVYYGNVTVTQIRYFSKIIKVEIPKEIWDAHMSIFNFRDIIGAWMKSINNVVNQMSKQNENE